MGSPYIKPLTAETEERVRRNPSLNIDSFIMPSPYAADEGMEKDYAHSFVWEEEREILGFLQTYSNPAKKRYFVYKQVTSPFGRGKGIGSAFLAQLVETVPSDALIDICVWERQAESVGFFARRGFKEVERIPWRALTFLRMEGGPAGIRDALAKQGGETGAADELGKIRHDAKKAIRLIADMAGALSAENCSRIIEDINRETTALVNTLNQFRDTVQRFRTVNVKDLVLDRIVPMVEHSPIPCELRLRLCSGVGEARAHYVDAARAIVNLVSNALDAIRAANRPGILSISIKEESGWVRLSVEDNGVGIEAAKLELGPNGAPKFVGVTTKAAAGEGQGTRQIYATFGAENITVESEAGAGTKWTIRLPRAEEREEGALLALETRLAEFRSLTETDIPDGGKDRAAVAACVWRNRKLDILTWDLILQFSRKNNVREVFRNVLAFRNGAVDALDFKQELSRCRTDTPELRNWLADAARLLKRNDAVLERIAPEREWQGIRFKAYGQAVERTVIFTFSPASGRFGATDRKLAEHADFVPYLGAPKENLLRGEFFGDVQNPANPIQLGVWEIRDADDARKKAALVRSGARKLIEMGVKSDKKLLFYEATWRRCGIDLDAARPRTLGSVAGTGDEELGELLVEIDDEGLDYVTTD